MWWHQQLSIRHLEGAAVSHYREALTRAFEDNTNAGDAVAAVRKTAPGQPARSPATFVGLMPSQDSSIQSGPSKSSLTPSPRTRLRKMWEATGGKMPGDAEAEHRYRNTHAGRTLALTTPTSAKAIAGSSPPKRGLPKLILEDKNPAELVPMLPLSCPTVQASFEPRRIQKFPRHIDYVSKKNIDYHAAFVQTCKEKYSSLVRAWRVLVDPDGVGRVSYVGFCKAARSIGFSEVDRLWSIVDSSHSGFITLDEWDPVSFRHLYEFRVICLREFGSMSLAFRYGMDRTKSGTCTMKELEAFCLEQSFSGDVKMLFKALDVNLKRFITSDELDFMQRWQGEKFSHKNRTFDFGISRLQKAREERLRQQRLQYVEGYRAAHGLHSGPTSNSPRPNSNMDAAEDFAASPPQAWSSLDSLPADTQGDSVEEIPPVEGLEDGVQPGTGQA
mmetsp:Transcript_25875/g.59709  ORF Transcript_25875/g.59709 Transcript_25875/m.59709 type:complete len:444 (+) Transcript_25875:113-1444(+)